MLCTFGRSHHHFARPLREATALILCISGMNFYFSNSAKEATGPHQDKLSLACFNSGDVPELIGRLSVALSPTTHKVISLPMFRKDLRVSYYSVLIFIGVLH